ncbi:MAG: hypothetical protein ACI8PZ_003621 [Myxococcota bacterium]|jgi:hypothetical protein
MHADGLSGWTYELFERTMRSGIKPDGSPLKLPMSLFMTYTPNMTETELQAMWMALESLEPKPTPQ